MRFLWNHNVIRYIDRRAVGNRTVYTVEYDGKPVGCVGRDPNGDRWRYAKIDSGDQTAVTETTVWSPAEETRKDAADNLLSHLRPSAAWLA